MEFFPNDSTTPILSTHETATITGKTLTIAINNPQVPVDEKTCDATTMTLQQLADIYNILPTVASPRVATVPAGPSPRVATMSTQDAFLRVATDATPVAARTRSATTTAINLQQGWALLAVNEFGRLAQGVRGRIKGTDTIKFIQADKLLADRQPTYPRFVCTERPPKEAKFCMQMAVGGNLIEYPGNVSVATAKMEMIKILLNGVVSTPGAKFWAANVTNFYLNTPMEQHEFARVPFNLIPNEIVLEYELSRLVDKKGFVLVQVEKDMYRLPQAGILANKLLQAWLEPHGYYACEHTPGLWRHNKQPIMFTLVLDDFGIIARESSMCSTSLQL
jgi:hypothetical protein